MNWKYFGFFWQYSSSLANIQNLTNGYIYLQYNVVFDDMFHTVCGTGEYEVVTGSI